MRRQVLWKGQITLKKRLNLNWKKETNAYRTRRMTSSSTATPACGNTISWMRSRWMSAGIDSASTASECTVKPRLSKEQSAFPHGVQMLNATWLSLLASLRNVSVLKISPNIEDIFSNHSLTCRTMPNGALVKTVKRSSQTNRVQMLQWSANVVLSSVMAALRLHTRQLVAICSRNGSIKLRTRLETWRQS